MQTTREPFNDLLTYMECFVEVKEDQKQFYPPKKTREIGKSGGLNISARHIRSGLES